MSDYLSQIPQLLKDRKKKQRRVSDIALDNDIFLGLDNLDNIDQKFKIYSAVSAKSSYVNSPNFNRSLSINKKILASKVSFLFPDSGRSETPSTINKNVKQPSLSVIDEQNQKKGITQIQSPIQGSRKLIQTYAFPHDTKKSQESEQKIVRGSEKDLKDHYIQNQSLNKKRNSLSVYNGNQPPQSNLSISQPKQVNISKDNKQNQSANAKMISEYQRGSSIAVNTNQLIQKEASFGGGTYSSNNIKSKLNIQDMETFKRNLMINRSISTLRQNIAEFGCMDTSRSHKEDSSSSQYLNKLATFIYDFITTTSSSSKIAQPVHIPNVEKIFSQFNIDRKKFTSLQTNEEKEEYVVSQMYNQSTDQLKQMVEKINKRTEEFTILDEKEREKGKKHKNISELFSWIEIPCTFEALKRRVKYSLVEVLYGHDNLELLQAKNEQYNNTQKILKENIPSKHLSTLGEFAEAYDTVSGMSMVSSKKLRTVHLKMYDDGQNIGSSLLLKPDQKKLTTTSGSSQQSIKKVSTENSDGHTKVIPPKQIPQNPTDQIQNFDDKQFKEADIILQEKLKNFVWDHQNERTFQSYKKKAQKAFVGLDSMSRWQSIGMQPIIQKLGLEEKLDLYREQLLDKYQNGGILKETEKIFIINTSQLLISNIDKEYFQGMLDFICTEDILKLEEKIAENVILKYETIGEFLKAQRNDYLREKSDNTAEKIANTRARNIYDKLKDEKSFKSRQNNLNLQIDKIRRRLERKFESIQYYENLRKNPYVQHFIAQLKKAIAHKELDKKKFQQEETYYKNFAKRNHPPKNHKALFTITKGEDEIPITYQKSQKLFHPSSRLLIGLNELARIEENQKSGRNRNYLTEMTPHQQKQLEMQRATNDQFTNKLQDSKKLGEQQPNFAEYYSSGPIETRDFKNKNLLQIKEKDQTADLIHMDMKLKKPHQWISKEVEENSAIIIQKWVRRHLQMKKYQQMIEQMKEQQEKKMFSILKKWKDSKELISFIKDQTVKMARQKKQLTLNKYQRKLSAHFSQSQPNSPRSNTSTISHTNLNINNTKEPMKEKLGSNAHQRHKKVSSEYAINNSHSQAIHTLDKDRSDSISSINSKHSKHSYLGSMTSTKVGGTMTHDFSSYGLHPHNMVKKKSIKSTDDSMNYMSHGRSISDFQSPRSALFQSRQILPPSTVGSNNFVESQHNHQSTVRELKEQIDEDVNLENEAAPQEMHISNEQNFIQNQEQVDKNQKKIPISLQRKVSVTANQLKHQIYKMKDGIRDFSRKREELLLKQKKLFYGAKQGSLQIVKNSGFIFYPHDINSLDEKGNCPLYYVTKKGDEEFIEFLLRSEADVNMRCSEGNTPLHIAFQLGKENIIMDYLDRGGDLNIVNKNGQTPLAFASIQLLKMIGLEKGITHVEASKIGQRIDFDNNKIFSDTHNTIETSNHFKEFNSPITIIKKKKDRRPEEEIATQELYFQFIPTSSTLDQKNYDRFAKGIKTQQKSIRTGDVVTKIQSFVEPQFRAKKRESFSSFLDFSEKVE